MSFKNARIPTPQRPVKKVLPRAGRAPSVSDDFSPRTIHAVAAPPPRTPPPRGQALSAGTTRVDLRYVIDAADNQRLEETVTELGQLVDEAKLADIPVLVYANKCDLMNAMEAEEIEDQASTVLKGREYTIVECSAKTGKGLQEGMEWLVERVNDKA